MHVAALSDKYTNYSLHCLVPLCCLWQYASCFNPPWLPHCQSALFPFPFPSLNPTSLCVSQVKRRVNFIDAGEVLTLPTFNESLVYIRHIQVSQETLNSPVEQLFETFSIRYVQPSPFSLSSYWCLHRCTKVLCCVSGSPSPRGFAYCNELRGINTEQTEKNIIERQAKVL